jgi:RNA polymerase sigma factor (sigma-70 family)
MSFEALSLRFAAGDLSALAETILMNGPAMRAILTRQFTGRLRPLEIDDVLQIAYLRAWRDRAQFDPVQGLFGAWLFGIARHAAQELARDNWVKQRQRETESDFRQSAAPRPDEHDRLAADAQDGARSSPRRAALSLALLTLTDRQRYMLIAKFRGLSIDEISDECGVCASTVRNTISQAMTKVRSELAKNGHAPPPAPA